MVEDTSLKLKSNSDAISTRHNAVRSVISLSVKDTRLCCGVPLTRDSATTAAKWTTCL